MQTRKSTEEDLHLEYTPAVATVIERCHRLASFTDVPGETTRLFLSPAMKQCLDQLGLWMESAGFSVTVDAAGNLRGLYPGKSPDAPRLLIGSHLDTVPNAGAFDGVLGVVLGLTLLELLKGERFSFAVELIGFSDEEGVRYQLPFIGSRALVGELNPELLALEDANGIPLRQAIANFNLDPAKLPSAIFDPRSVAYLEFHIEQGPVLEDQSLSLGIVHAIVGQTRGEATFLGRANHAGTTPMNLRRDALAAAAQWVGEIERRAKVAAGMAATVGRLEVFPGAGNVIAGEAKASFDVRHADDVLRRSFVAEILECAGSIAKERGTRIQWKIHMDQPAVPMDRALSKIASVAVAKTGVQPLRMTSGGGHDAMIVAGHLPSTMIFLRSPGGVSHHPEESVRPDDLENALAAGLNFLRGFEESLSAIQAQGNTQS